MTFGKGLPPFISLDLEADEQAALSGGSTGGASDSSTGGFANKVYIGPKAPKVSKGTRGRKTYTIPGSSDETKTVQDALLEFYNWSDEEYNSFVGKLRNLGYIKAGQLASPPIVQAIYESAVYGASKWYANSKGAARVTVDQYIDWYAKKTEPTGPKVSKTVTEYGPQQIQGWINEGLLKDAGRTYDSLSDAEKEIFNAAVAEYAQASTTTTTTRNKAGQVVTTIQPGVSPEATIKEKVAEVGQAVLAPDFERQQRFDFQNWLSQNVQGA